ncbi:signal peptidase I [Cellulosimicrobium sp. Marseille-Q4280]|uniref:signal peptidase I n=1 Tax=Cellulosimicrobium sp. Marseille-Q4280 TaxID=2937992 RepID=UPI00203AECBA|nr:signal peptidase I [Cellulosimicrobium sp. Marseille-Q4280]
MTLTHDTETDQVAPPGELDPEHTRRADLRDKRPSRVSRAARTVRKVTSALVTVGVLVLLVTNFILPTLAQNRGMEMFSVLSGSMEPGLHTRSTVLVDTDINAENLAVGEAITFMTGRNKPPTTHRIIEVFTDDAGKTFYRTQGDANEDPDTAPVSPANVIGVLDTDLDDVWTAPGDREVPLGQAVTWTRTTEGRIALIAPAVAGFVLGELAVALGGTFMDPRTWSRRRKDA